MNVQQRRFLLVRANDVSGVSGTGVVAEGTLFTTGKAVLAWVTQYRSVAVYDSLAELEAIHGHNGATVVQWIDGLGGMAARQGLGTPDQELAEGEK